MSDELSARRPRITAHRGLSWDYPENTLPSFQAAIDAGPDFVELDFYTSKDGVLFCMHDETLDRYLAGQHPEMAGKHVGDFTMSELRQLDVGVWKDQNFAGTGVATLTDVVTLFARRAEKGACPKLMLEHKTGSVEQMLNVLKAFASPEQYVVMSFDWDFLREVHAKAPQITLTALGGWGEHSVVTPELVREMKRFGATAGHWWDRMTSAEVKFLHEAGLEAWMYTLNTELAYRGAQAMGIDAITTDRCDYAKAFFAMAED